MAMALHHHHLHLPHPPSHPRFAPHLSSSSFELRPTVTLLLTRSSSSLSSPASPVAPELIRETITGGGDSPGDNGNGNGYGNGGGGHGGDHNGNGSHGHGDDPVAKASIFSAFFKGWNERTTADPQFPFKVLMEEVVGVGACVIGDMASRPNFGLNELDFVFSTIVVGSILNFSLMYMLAPTSSAVATANACRLPSIFATCPPGYMFEKGSYSLIERLGTFVYKGALFASVGFAAGLLGTTISNILIGMRTKMDPAFKIQNKAPPTVLNAATWAVHMGASSNLRYQAINGLEFAMANVLPPPAFKASVFLLRAGNNVLGGMSFVALARFTGSQKAEAKVADIDKHAQFSAVKENECVLSSVPQLSKSVNTSSPSACVGLETSITESSNTSNQEDHAREEDGAGHGTSDQRKKDS